MNVPVSAFKALSSNEYTVTPFSATAPFSYTYTSGSPSNSPDVNLEFGVKYYQYDNLRVENTHYELYDSVIQNFYSPLPYAMYGTTKRSYIPRNYVYVISMTQDVIGEEVVPGTFSATVSSSKLYDDNQGNLIISSSGTGSVIGRIFYDKGIALVKPKPSPNINPDPLWTQGDSISGTGWEFLLETCPTNDLASKGVLEPYPGTPTVAAKIGTRTGTYWSGGSFFKHTVSSDRIYDISGWVYAGATTFRALQNGRVAGSDYKIGYLLTYLDSSDSVVGYEPITTNNPTDSTSGDYGWVFLSKRIRITDSNVAKFTIATFIDGPYPSGFGYGNPVCADGEPDCPGYAWFADFRVENIVIPATAGLDNTGLYITGGMSITTNFTSSVKLYEHNVKVKLNPNDFNFSLYNPSVENKLPFYTGSTATPFESMISRSRNPEQTEYLAPYITTIGLYNESNDLLAIAKLSNPIQRTFDSIQTIIVKFDT